MRLGTLDFAAVAERDDILAPRVRAAVNSVAHTDIYAASIDPALSDTAAFCARYDISLHSSANCVIVAAKRADRIQYAACMILAADRADINGAVRRYLDARKISFAPMDEAVQMTAMEYGGITPIGLPESWPIIVDERVAQAAYVVVGSGLRKSKLLLPGFRLAALPHAATLAIAKDA